MSTVAANLGSHPDTLAGDFLPELSNDRVTIIFGLPRSGTTWLAKMFDSHPAVLYRHEPDSILRPTSLPEWPGTQNSPELLSATRAYLQAAATLKKKKSAGSKPVFPKNYLSQSAYLKRAGAIYADMFAEKVLRLKPSALPDIPDFISDQQWSDIRLVMKSISSVNRMGLFLRAVPGSKSFFILRHPLGQVASMLRGIALRKFEGKIDLRWILRSPVASQFSLGRDAFDRMDTIESLAWQWTILTTQAAQDVAGISDVSLVRHEDLLSSPHLGFMNLFARAGLAWNQQTNEFLDRTINPDCARYRRGYYGLTRNPETEIGKWRHELTAEQQKKVWKIASMSAMARYWPEGIS